MPVIRRSSCLILLAFLAVAVPVWPASAANAPHRACLNKAEQRAAVASHRAVPLAQAIKSLRAHGHRAEVVRAALCRRGDGLVYALTLLARNGKVTRVHVDAGNGTLIAGH
jgi:uncharacterized membrane protein YkoI